MNFTEYIDALRARFAGKDPRRVAGAFGKTGGRIVLVLKERGEVRRATIAIGGPHAAKGVTVDVGAPKIDDAPTAFVFAAIDDWIAFFERADADRVSSIDFFGDATVLGLLPALAAQTQSPLHARLAHLT